MFFSDWAGKLVKKYAAKAGIKDDRTHPHTFLHSFATHSVLNDTPVLVAQGRLGHASHKNTLVHLQVVQKDTKRYYEAKEFCLQKARTSAYQTCHKNDRFPV